MSSLDLELVLGGFRALHTLPAKSFALCALEDLDRPTAAFVVVVIDLSKVEHSSLDKLAAPAASLFHHAPVAMLFAVFDPEGDTSNITATESTLRHPIFSPEK